MKTLLGLLLLLPCILVDAQGSLLDLKAEPTAGSIDAAGGNRSPTKVSDFSLGDDDDDDDDDDEGLDDQQLNVQAPKVSAARPFAAPVSKAPRIPKNALNESAVKSQVLEYINYYRRLHGAGPLMESSGMSLGAKNWANNLLKLGTAKDDTSSKYGQTHCLLRVAQATVAPECVLSWYRQIQDYDWANRKLLPNNKRFVQLVWKNTTHIGIGVARGPLGKFFIVAFYDPVGKDEAKLSENVQSYTDMFAQVPGVICPTGFTEYQGTCYKYHTEKQSWMNALATCAKEKAVLASITDINAETSIKNWPIKGKSGPAWISLNDRLKESMYMSVEGSPVTYMNWIPSEPNGKGQNCVALDLNATFGTMKDLNCNELNQFICKMPLEGEIAYRLKIKLSSMVWLDDFLQPYSLAYQELNKKLDKTIKDLYKDTKIFKSATVESVSYVRESLPSVPTPPLKVGKRQIAVKVNPAPTAGVTTPGATTSGVGAKPTTPKPKGPKKVVVTLLLKFGNKDIPGDPTKPLQDYLAKHAGKLAQPFNEPAKILSISILPPGSVPSTSSYCAPQCAYSCVSSCNPSCCFTQPPPSYNPQPYQQQPQPQRVPQANNKGSKTAAKAPVAPARAASPCIPTPYSPCTTSYSVPPQPPVYMPPVAPPCIPSVTTSCSPVARSKAFPVRKPLARLPVPMNIQTRASSFPAMRPCVPTLFRRCPRFVSPYTRVLPRFIQAKPNVRAVMPPNPCGPNSISPCPPPMMAPPMPMPMPLPPPMPISIPIQYPQYPAAAPCNPGVLNKCPPPAKKGVKGKAKGKAAPVAPKPLIIQGQTYPPMSITLQPPPPLQMPMPMPCSPLAGPPCSPSLPKVAKSKPKSQAPRKPVTSAFPMAAPCMPSAFNPCPPPQPPVLPMGPPCGPVAGMPCGPPQPRPVVIKLPAIHIKMPKQPPPPPMPQMPQMPMLPPMGCPPACTSLPVCAKVCPKPCCKRTRMGRAAEEEKQY